MFGKIFKGIAVAVGVGFAVGVMAGKRRTGDHAARRAPENFASGPVLERLERIESRIAAGEARPAVSYTETIVALDQRLERQSRDVASLRQQLDNQQHEIATGLEGIGKRLDEVTSAVPALVESLFTPRSGDLELRLRAETQQTVRTALTNFERTLDDKVSDRISVIEKAMVDQSAAVTSLSQRAIELELILQRLISGVERLCERTNATLETLPAKEPAFIDSPLPVRSPSAA